MLKLITYSLKTVPFSKISKGVRRYNTTNLLVLFKALINTNKYSEVIFW
jgi:hypothetical protein